VLWGAAELSVRAQLDDLRARGVYQGMQEN